MKYNNSFSNLRAKILNEAFLVPFFVIAVTVVVVLLNFWYSDKLDGADFKYDISFFEFQTKNSQKGPFLSKFKNFIIGILINLKVLFSNMAIIF